jgi:hypothetical protein
LWEKGSSARCEGDKEEIEGRERRGEVEKREKADGRGRARVESGRSRNVTDLLVSDTEERVGYPK